MSESKQANQTQNRAVKRKRQLKKPQQLQPAPASLEPRIEPVEPVTALQRATSAPQAAIRPADILTLQRAVGNQAVTRLLAARGDGQAITGPARRLPSQSKLRVGPVGDQTFRNAAGSVIQRELTEPVGFDRDYLESLVHDAEKRGFIKRYLGSSEVLDALDDLYFVAYDERMKAKTTQEQTNVNKWWNRYKVFEEKRDSWKTLMTRDDFDIPQALAEWLKLKNAYRRLENRQDDIVPKTPSEAAQNIYADMKAQFEKWDGTLKNRGAWWGSKQPGNPTGAKSVANSVVTELADMTANTTWRSEPSWSGGLSFHRTKGAVDFIYHMQPPPG